MPDFSYQARNATGKDLSGVITAASKRDVFSLLKERGLFPVRVDETKGPIQFTYWIRAGLWSKPGWLRSINRISTGKTSKIIDM